jgi:hypothetical protein
MPTVLLPAENVWAIGSFYENGPDTHVPFGLHLQAVPFECPKGKISIFEFGCDSKAMAVNTVIQVSVPFGRFHSMIHYPLTHFTMLPL